MWEFFFRPNHQYLYLTDIVNRLAIRYSRNRNTILVWPLVIGVCYKHGYVKIDDSIYSDSCALVRISLVPRCSCCLSLLIVLVQSSSSLAVSRYWLFLFNPLLLCRSLDLRALTHSSLLTFVSAVHNTSSSSLTVYCGPDTLLLESLGLDLILFKPLLSTAFFFQPILL